MPLKFETAGEPVKKTSKAKILIPIGVVVVLAAAALVFLLTRSSDKADAQPTRAEIAAALLSIHDVRDSFNSSWNTEEYVGSSDPFCPQFIVPEPKRQADALFHLVDPSDPNVEVGMYENISSFSSVDEAKKFFDQDKAISENCRTSDGTLGDRAITYTITDTSEDVKDSVGHDAVGVRYEAAYKDDPSTVVLTGFVVEATLERVTMSTNFFIFGRDPTDEDISDYYDLTKVAFDKASAAL
jgi:hypothetical protein